MRPRLHLLKSICDRVRAVHGHGVSLNTFRHAHECFVFGQILRGTRTLVVGGVQWQLVAGDMFWIAPHTGHACVAAPHDYRILAVAPELAPAKCRAVWGQGGRIPADRVVESGPCLDRLSDAPSARGLEALFGTVPMSAPRSRKGEEHLRRMHRYLRAHALFSLSLHSLARECGLSPGYVQRLFVAGFGCSPWEYQLKLRVRHALWALLQGQGPAETALACGFADQSHLTRGFRRIMGISPGAYRRQNLGS